MSDNAKLLFDMFVLLLSGCAVSLALTPLIRTLARRGGLVDRPDGRRKMHAEAIPVAGGVAVFLSSAAVLLFALTRMTAWGESVQANLSVFASLLAASAVIVAVGIVDDAWGLRGKVKLMGQLVAIGIVIAGGVRIDGITLFDYRFGDWGLWFSIPFTALWLLLAINSLNLLDGMDGLLGSVSAILCVTIGAMAFFSNNYAAACVAVTLAGSLLGFLFYNFPPATIFLGDAGSMLIGLVVGTLAIQASLKGPATVGLMLPVTLMMIPIFDTTAAIVRRKLTGRSIYQTDRGHLHHMLLGSGMSKPQVLLIINIFVGVLCFGVIFISLWQKSELYALGLVALIVGSSIAFRLFGHSEFQLAKKRFESASTEGPAPRTNGSCTRNQGSPSRHGGLGRNLGRANERGRVIEVSDDVPRCQRAGFSRRLSRPLGSLTT